MVKLDLNSFKNTDYNSVVKHEGIISKISKNKVTVSLFGNANCETCNAKGACGVSDSSVKEIEIFDVNNSYQLQETVHVILKKELGLKAVFFAYVFPFILMFFILIISIPFFKEWIAGLLSILVLIPYYLIIYLMKNPLEKMFKISIIKIN
ncbi:MAG: SoxR reducing system RseC family protein [Lutibacter sp.]|uniref:SoxR reducing system RseC family protein n=1 Tax=Lutibacter sp. TaxID=1925666 RepID=UPI00299D2E91|nr:SoxR reducing system RseC family protein [Lutibacter sp.]MDX1828823.1 SoxR reducing system RseC family protein [Lutibacter sp.]